MSASAVACALAFTATDGSTIVVSVGPNGCAVSRNQRHIGRVETGKFMAIGDPLPAVDTCLVELLAARLWRFVGRADEMVAAWVFRDEEAGR